MGHFIVNPQLDLKITAAELSAARDRFVYAGLRPVAAGLGTLAKYAATTDRWLAGRLQRKPARQPGDSAMSDRILLDPTSERLGAKLPGATHPTHCTPSPCEQKHRPLESSGSCFTEIGVCSCMFYDRAWLTRAAGASSGREHVA